MKQPNCREVATRAQLNSPVIPRSESDEESGFSLEQATTWIPLFVRDDNRDSANRNRETARPQRICRDFHKYCPTLSATRYRMR
jgi:hypothetical protein